MVYSRLHVMFSRHTASWISCALLVIIGSVAGTAVTQDINDDASDVARPEFNGETYKQFTRKLFNGEQTLILDLSDARLTTEVYIQSLGHSQVWGMDTDLTHEQVIDDKYFLASVDLSRIRDQHRVEKHLFSRKSNSLNRYIQANAYREELVPEGELAMFFVDTTSFDADTYLLSYKQSATIEGNNVLLFTVHPRDSRGCGRFEGEIWVDPRTAQIIRIRGSFARSCRHLAYRDKYFHFDSWRERTPDGRWVPNVAYFDEGNTFKSDKNIEFHYRGYTFLWQHRPGLEEPSVGGRSPGNSGQESNANIAHQLEADGLLASPGPTDRMLDAIVGQILAAHDLPENSIRCRTLVTTPLDLFSIDNTVFVSRGLLNLVPDEKVLGVLLARQIAEINLGQSRQSLPILTNSIFDLRGSHDFAGLGIRRTTEQNVETARKATALLQGTPFADASGYAQAFLSHLENESYRFPNLVRARFGMGLIAVRKDEPRHKPPATPDRLSLRGTYAISWNGKLEGAEFSHLESTSFQQGR